MRKRIANLLWGLIFIAAGVLFAGKVLGLWELNVSLRTWWPLVLIVPSLIAIIRKGFQIGNFLGIVFGTLFLLQGFQVITFQMIREMILPTVLLTIGLVMVFRGVFRIKARRYEGKTVYASVFSGNHMVLNENDSFDGCTAEAVFGEVTLDLRNMNREEDTVIEASAVFGNVTVFVPEGMHVVIYKNVLFGDAEYCGHKQKDAPVLYVNAFVMFGGVTIK